MNELAQDMNGIFRNLLEPGFARGFLKNLAEQAGLSINGLAKKAGISTSTAHAVVTGKRGPSLETYSKLIVAATDEIIKNQI